jgi:hypothetical protein
MAKDDGIAPAYKGIMGITSIPTEGDPLWREWAITTNIQINLYHTQITELEANLCDLKDKVQDLEVDLAKLIGKSESESGITIHNTINKSDDSEEEEEPNLSPSKIRNLIDTGKEYASLIIVICVAIYTLFNQLF